jgi:hypothetical protein
MRIAEPFKLDRIFDGLGIGNAGAYYLVVIFA